MNQILDVVFRVLSGAIIIIEVLLFVRAVLSWIPFANESKIGLVVYKLTEPVIKPCRYLVSKSSVVQDSFIDISFLVAILILEIMRKFILQNVF